MEQDLLLHRQREKNKDYAVTCSNAISFIYADLLSKNAEEKWGDRIPKRITQRTRQS